MYGYIYQLNHEYISGYTDDGEPLYQNKELGYFSTFSKAKNVIEKYKTLKGFKDYDINCFKITKRRINKSEISNKIIFELYHSYIENGYEEFEYLGIFSTNEKASNKIKHLIQKKSKYRQNPDGFDISEELLDSENIIWSEGFDASE